MGVCSSGPNDSATEATNSSVVTGVVTTDDDIIADNKQDGTKSKNAPVATTPVVDDDCSKRKDPNTPPGGDGASSVPSTMPNVAQDEHHDVAPATKDGEGKEAPPPTSGGGDDGSDGSAASTAVTVGERLADHSKTMGTWRDPDGKVWTFSKEGLPKWSKHYGIAEDTLLMAARRHDGIGAKTGFLDDKEIKAGGVDLSTQSLEQSISGGEVKDGGGAASPPGPSGVPPPAGPGAAPPPAVVHPRGWSEHEHEGETYYNNDHTGFTTFTKPTLPAAPEGWSVLPHGDDGEYYFQNDAGGGESQWHHPHDEEEPIHVSLVDATRDWRHVILTMTGEDRKMIKGGSGHSTFHAPIDSMPALLGHLLCWHEDGITDAEWGERFYQWGVAVGISKATLHTIAFSMLAVARTIPWVGPDTAGGEDSVGSYDPAKSRAHGEKVAHFLETYAAGDVEVAPLSTVPGLGKTTVAAFATGGGGLEHGWEPPAPGQDESFRMPITSFPCLMGHLLILHHESIDAHAWADRFVEWGVTIGMRQNLLHPIVCALLEVAQLLPCVPNNTLGGLAMLHESHHEKSHTSAEKLASFLENTSAGCIVMTDVPSIGPAVVAILGESEDDY